MIKSFLLKVKEESGKVGLKLRIQKKKSMVSSPITLWQFDGKKMETLTDFIFLGSKITMDGTVGMKLKDACSRKENYDKPRPHIKNQRHHFVNKGPCNQSYVFSSSQVHM